MKYTFRWLFRALFCEDSQQDQVKEEATGKSIAPKNYGAVIDPWAEIVRLRAALTCAQIEAGTHLFHRMRSIEMNSRLLDDLEERTGVREESYRLRRALDLLGVPAQAKKDSDKAAPLRITVEIAKRTMGVVNGSD